MRISLLIFSTLSTLGMVAQTNYPVSFTSPIDTTILLAGNFGEVRPNHFHFGWDIKTANKEGKNIYAVEDGYISRIKIGPHGYGKALYVTHYNGYTSVYGHLKDFKDEIQQFALKEQFRTESFEIDIKPEQDQIKVKKGQWIAISGNTGSSGGPHLHFEIRDTKTEDVLNPYLFNYKIKDSIRPELLKLGVFPLSDSSSVQGSNKIFITGISKKGNQHSLSGKKIIVSGPIGIGIETLDRENNSTGKNQVYNIRLLVDDTEKFNCTFNRLPFTESRCSNAHGHYATKNTSNITIQKCYIDKNNKLGFYNHSLGNGIIHFSDTSEHSVKIIVSDYNGNNSDLQFVIKNNNSFQKYKPEKEASKWIDCHDKELFKMYGDDIAIELNPGILYNDIKFNYSFKDSAKKFLSSAHIIHDYNVPVHDYFMISVKHRFVPENKLKFLFLAYKNNKGGIKFINSTYNNGWLTAKVNNFGTYGVMMDTVPPKIKPAGYMGASFNENSPLLGFVIDDDLSGIKSYRAELDGKWLLMEYEPKKNLLWCYNNEAIVKGKHRLKIVVTDNVGNEEIFYFNFNK